MAKYTLICEHDEFEGTLKNTIEFRSDFLPEVLDNFEMFLRGAGFYFDGKLEIIDQKDNSYTEELEDLVNTGVFQQVVDDHIDYLDNQKKEFFCDICGMPMSVMQGQKCYDLNCPKDN